MFLNSPKNDLLVILKLFFLDINECLSQKTNKCPENTTCINTYGSYKCECNKGFRRKAANLDPKKHGCEGNGDASNSIVFLSFSMEGQSLRHCILFIIHR